MNYLNFFNKIINNVDFDNVVIKENIGTSGITSIVLYSEPTPYRSKVDNILIARIKSKGNRPYISFKSKYEYWFLKRHIETFSVKSDNGFFRIELSDFLNKVIFENDFNDLLKKICLDAMNFNTFGCCGKYKECSISKKCLHNDKLYATGCYYRKNLEAGKVFY